MIGNNLRVLEQKVNASDKLGDTDKFDLQQYITRCYGSLTTFNILFKTRTTSSEPAPRAAQCNRLRQDLTCSRLAVSRRFESREQNGSGLHQQACDDRVSD